MPTTAVLLPGQGAFYGGVLRELNELRPEVGDLLREMGEAPAEFLGEDLADCLLVQPARPLEWWLAEKPELLQVAIVAVDVVVGKLLLRDGLVPDVVAGHSLGEIAALCVAGALTPAQATEITTHRTIALRAAPRGGMAVISVPLPRVEALLAAFDSHEVSVAVVNNASQVVISGTTHAMDMVSRAAHALGMPTTRLPAPHPFHHAILSGVAQEFGARIAHIRPGPAAIPVYSPIERRQYRSTDSLVESLASHLLKPLRFDAALDDLLTAGYTTFVEGGALSALTRMIGRAAVTRGIDISAVAPLPGTGDELGEWSDGLAELGIRAATMPSLDDLRRFLLPQAESAEFEQFWMSQRDLVRSQIAAAYAEHRASHPAQAMTSGERPIPEPVRTSSILPPVALTAAVSGELSPGSGTPVPPTQVMDELVAMYAEALEYPAEVFEEDTQLEAELGIDSVKQTELIGRVAQRFGLPAWGYDFQMAEYDTLGKIRDLVLRAAPALVEV